MLLRANASSQQPDEVRVAAIHSATEAILEPFGLATPHPENRFRNSRVSAIAEDFVTAVLGSHDKKRTLPLAMAGTSDFPELMDNVVRTALLAGWEAGPRSYQRFAGTLKAGDFRPQANVRFGGLSRLRRISEGEEIPGGSFSAYVSEIKASRNGLMLHLTEEMLLNNNLAAVIKGAQAIGRAAASTINAAVFNVLRSNPALSDGGALFNATATDQSGGHANAALVDAAISKTSLAIGKAAMRRQCAPKSVNPLNIRPRFLIVSAEAEEDAWGVAGLPFGFGEGGSDVERYMINSGRVEILSDPELEGSGWYLAADPVVAPVVEVAFVDGVAEPVIAAQRNFSSDALHVKVTFDFGVAPGDWRGGYKNAGA